MAPLPTRRETEDWLAANGWFPGRDVGALADELVAVRVQDADEQGAPLVPSKAAVDFIHSYGDLTLTYPNNPQVTLILKPTIGYRGDAEEINELGKELGEPLFPVGFETGENGIILVTPRGRFFYLHHTGGYYLGENALEALGNRLGGGLLQDAEDFFVAPNASSEQTSPSQQSPSSAPSPSSDRAVETERGPVFGPFPAVASSLLVSNQVLSLTSLQGDGQPNLHPSVQAFLDSLPPSQREPFTGYCAESLLVSDQLWQLDAERSDGSVCSLEQARPHFAGSAIISRAVREPGDPEHGQQILPCRSCTALLEAVGVQILLP
ncbi:MULTISPECIES: SUKH-3 domain-containing protein [Kitasatospora]|uniref:YwqJ-like deaminase n=1 Tax=Kitasatospora cystarginea TaxID=58350 RepID=A0ABN3ENQ5_9ACTN